MHLQISIAMRWMKMANKREIFDSDQILLKKFSSQFIQGIALHLVVRTIITIDIICTTQQPQKIKRRTTKKKIKNYKLFVWLI